MKYKMSKKIKSFSAINDFHGLGKKKAKELESGKFIEIKKPPKNLIDGEYIIKEKGNK
tara:strand:- start:25 stop:198 length:174 start_codon:yes stop_codon:yes gene_type:complete